MASKRKQQNLFKGAENRLSEYEAKQAQAAKRIERRSKDNRLALIAGVVALAIAFASQLVYSKVHPTPTATVAVTAAPSSTPSSTPSNGPLVPNPSIAQNRVWTGTMAVNAANLGIELYGDRAPQATANFISLVNKGFYKGVTCHRLVTSGIFVLQCGDPKGDGTGGPGYSFGPIENAPTAAANGTATYAAGTIAMANSGSAYSNGSQFFIVYKDSPLAPNYTVFGKVTSNLAGLAPIINGGVKGGGTDGKPNVATVLGVIKLK